MDENGQAKNGQQVEQIKPYFSASLRGSNPRRFKMMEDGITLYSALPHKETAQAGRYGAWNGPSPNLSMQIKDQYPRNGDFAIRVKASKGYAFDVLALNAKSLTKAKPLAELDKNNTSLKKPAKGVNRFVVLAKNAKKTYLSSPEEYTGYSNVKTGKILCLVGIVLNVLFIATILGVIAYFGLDALSDPELMQQRLEELQ